MTRARIAIVGLAAAVGLTACKKKQAEQGSGTGTAGPGTGSAVTPTGPRPSQGTLPVMPALALPDDPARAAKEKLGNALFFDKRLSVDGSRACYSCHMNENGTGGAEPLAIGAGDKPLTRHSPALWNVGYQDGAFYWDGRSKTLEEQALAAWAGGNLGVGKDNLAAKAKELAKIDGYKTMFEEAFGKVEVTPELVAQALAAYERTITCSDTAYDKFAAGDKAALTEQQQRGLDVFLGKGGCSACHTPPHFTMSQQVAGGAYFNAGVGIAGHADADVDPGRQKVTEKPEDWAAFKIPTLRDISRTAPYFHDGSMATLEEAVHYMASGALANKNLSPLLANKNLTDAEQADLVAFLHGLDCGGKLAEPTLP